MPSRRLIRLRPAVPADTALDVAMTVIRPVAARDPEVEPEPGVQERHEEDAAADAEQRSEPAGDGAGATTAAIDGGSSRRLARTAGV